MNHDRPDWATPWGRQVLITGGTGSFGNALVTHLLALDDGPERVVVYSRDEYKQHVMRERFREHDSRVRFFLGDVRDRMRLRAAMRGGVDVVVHAAALKQVPALEYNPTEAVKTNVVGAMNVVDCALEAAVPWVLQLSTDKACAPVNLYGASKLTAEKLMVAANALAGRMVTRFAVVRYGNVTGSRGSVIPVWREALQADRPLPVTDPNMTRFWMVLPETVAFVECCLGAMRGGEVFVPQLPAYCLGDLAAAMLQERPNYGLEVVGMRPGEKMHEYMISPDEAWMAHEWDGGLVLLPPSTIDLAVPGPRGGTEPTRGLYMDGYSSANAEMLKPNDLRRMLEDVP